MNQAIHPNESGATGRKLSPELVASLALTHLVQMRDWETGDHILRTQEYVRQLALDLRRHGRHAGLLTDAYIQRLTHSAPLHDIGKVGIPDHILLKPGRLDPEERLIIQTHTIIGAEAIEALAHDMLDAGFLCIAKEIARSHHERWDGLGYPDRLQGDAIPLAARLMSVADVFDALISRRVYKPALDFDTARAIIEQGRGTQFDPDVVDAFVRCFDTFCAIARRITDPDHAELPTDAPGTAANAGRCQA